MVMKKKEVPFQPSGETQRIKSLGGGTYAYVFDHLGKTHHLKVESQEFVDLCRTLNETFQGKIVTQLEELGWHETIAAIYTTETDNSESEESREV